jgi:hypothetical protein
MRHYEIVGSRNIKIRVKTKKLWVKQFLGVDVAFKLRMY